MRHVLLCPPDYYGIEYEINPWMDRNQGADRVLASTQWQRLRETLQSLGCAVEIIEPQPGFPDMVFTANAGLVVGDKFIRSNFRWRERRGEAAFFERWFAGHGYQVVTLPEKLIFEGEGDALFVGDLLVCGYRFRSNIRSHQWLSEFLQCLAISVELVDARFYHLDTCFCPLAADSAIWHPQAFDEYGQNAIRQHVPNLIEVAPEEASRFACNAVVLDRVVLLAAGCRRLADDLSGRGYDCHELDMSEFIKAGGACKCLTLLLPSEK